MRAPPQLRDEALVAALDDATAGKRTRLFDLLAIASGLPGERANLTLAQAFANACAGKKKKADDLVFAMATLDARTAPGATSREFLPVCGILALGERAAADKSIRERALAVLHDAAEDPRFRVRKVVPTALARIGAEMGDELLQAVEHWMNGYFQAAAVLLAMCDSRWLGKLRGDDYYLPVIRIDQGLTLIKHAPRAAARYPGFKALLEVLGTAPATLGTHFGLPVFDRLVSWTECDMPEIRDAIRKNLKDKRLVGRWSDQFERVRHWLEQNEKPPRDPTRIVHGMRGRGKKRGGC